MSTYSITPKYYTNPGAPPKPPTDRNAEDPLQKLRNAGTVNMSTELFEKLYLRETRVASRHEETYNLSRPRSFGDPKPIGYVGIVIGLTPLSCDLMGILGAGGNGAAGIGSYYFFGGMLQILAGLGEWFLGNTFHSVVFTAIGAFFFSFAATLTPSFAAFASYAPADTPASAGLETQAFNASFGWFLLWLAVLSLVFFICSLRTNAALIVFFGALVGSFASLATSFFMLANAARLNAAAITAASNASLATGTVVFASKAAGLAASQTAEDLVKAGGACAFVASMAMWWLLLAAMLEALEFPILIPLGDTSRWIKPRPAKRDEPRVYV